MQAIFRDRPPILVRHIVTNVLVEVISKTEARGTNYLTMLSSHASIEPPQEAGGIYVGEFEDHYVKNEGEWQFQSRRGRVVLHMGGADARYPAANRRSERTFLMVQAANADEQLVLDFFEVLSSGDLEKLRGFYHEASVWEPKVKDIAGAGKHVGMDIIDKFLAPVRGMFNPGDPKVHVHTMFSRDGLGLRGKQFHRRAARRQGLRQRLLLGVRDFERQDRQDARIYGLALHRQTVRNGLMRV